MAMKMGTDDGVGMGLGGSIQVNRGADSRDEDGYDSDTSTASAKPMRSKDERATRQGKGKKDGKADKGTSRRDVAVAHAKSKIQAACEEILNAQEQAPNKARYAARGVVFGSLIIEPFYSFFLWQSILGSVADLIKDFGLPVSEAWDITIKALSVVFAGSNLMSDIRSVLPFEEADEFIAGFSNPTGIKLLAMFLQAGFTVGSSIWGSATDVLPIASWTKLLKSVWEIDVINFPALAIILILGCSYYYAFAQGALVAQLDAIKEYKDDPKKFKELANRFKDYPMQGIEFLKRWLSTVLYRAVLFGFIPKPLFADVFNLCNDTVNQSVTIAAVGTTGVLTLMTRTLRIFNSIYPEHTKYLKPHEIDNASVLSGDYGKDARALIPAGLMTLVNGSAGLFLYTLIPWMENPIAMYVLNYGLPIAVGTLSAAQRALSDRQRLKEINALKTAVSQSGSIEAFVHTRKTSAAPAIEAGTASDAGESEPLLPVKNETMRKLRMDLSKKITEAIAEKESTLTTGNTIEITVINVLARLGRLTAFPKWFQGTLSTVGINLNPSQYASGALFFGTQIFEGDGAMFQANINEMTSITKVKIVYQRIYEEFKALWLSEMVANGERTPRCASFFKVMPSVFPAYFCSHYDYPMEVQLVAAVRNGVVLKGEDYQNIKGFCRNDETLQVALNLLTVDERSMVNKRFDRIDLSLTSAHSI